MGLGDEIMALGCAQRAHMRTGRQVEILDAYGERRWHPLWERSCIVGQSFDGQDLETIINAPHVRPYIERWETWEKKPQAIFKDGWRARDNLASLVLGENRLGMAKEIREKIGDFIIVGGRLKKKSSPNKAGRKGSWAAIAKTLQQNGLTIGEVIPNGEKPNFEGSRHFYCSNEWDIAIVMEASIGYCGNEGGLHHIAAALDKPATVVYGSFVSPEVTGYETHVNISSDHGPDLPLGCGRWAECPECYIAMGEITLDQVVDETQRWIKGAR